MNAAEAKRRKITYVKGVETSNEEMLQDGWKLLMTEDSQELVPPSPTSEGEEEEVQDSSPECEEDPESPAKN